jgi:hypothetical protein
MGLGCGGRRGRCTCHGYWTAAIPTTLLRSDSNVEPDINLKPGTNWKEHTFGDGATESSYRSE